MAAISQLTKALTGNENLQDCNESDLRRMVRLYPFFGPARVLLAKKAKDENYEDARGFSADASLFVPNALWFERLMGEPLQEKLEQYSHLRHDTILETPVTVEEVVAQPTALPEEAGEIVPDVAPEETVLEEPATEEVVISQTSPEPEAVDVPAESILEEPATREGVVEQVMPEMPKPISLDLSAELPAEMEGTDEEMEEAPEKDLGAEFRSILPSFKIEPLEPGKMELSFEPYHTVDYFASQGIRFKDDEKPKDRLGQQLKSFTEWLKTLKKVPATDIPATGNGQEEKKVEQMAQVSITPREVITEAMAEVWEKQGNTVKAIELYEKLSLLDPDKSAYFAAKIEHLKQL